MTEQGPQSSRFTASPACLLLLLSSNTSPGPPRQLPWSRYPPTPPQSQFPGRRPAELRVSPARWQALPGLHKPYPGIPKEEGRELTEELGDPDAPVSQ